MHLTGKLIMKGNTEQFGNNGFEKREIAIQTDEQFPQKILIQFTQQRCDLVNGLQKDELIKVHINLKGRDWVNPKGETKYFNSIEGWKVEKLSNNAQTSAPGPVAEQQKQTDPLPSENDGDDLPF